VFKLKQCLIILFIFLSDTGWDDVHCNDAFFQILWLPTCIANVVFAPVISLLL
jgi:hypothetical protein